MSITDNREENTMAEIFSKIIRAGKRTYFFDVKCTRNNEYYLTITESKKKFATDGNFRYEKHKLFLYPEDFEKFSETFTEVIDFINKNQPSEKAHENTNSDQESAKMETGKNLSESEFSKIDFDDI